MKKIILKTLVLLIGLFAIPVLIGSNQDMTAYADNQYNGSPYQDYYSITNSGKMIGDVYVDSDSVKVEVDYSKITPETEIITKDMLKVKYWDSNTENGDAYVVKETKDYQFRFNKLDESLQDVKPVTNYNKVNFAKGENYVYIYIGAYYNDNIDKYCAVEVPVKIKYNTVKFDLNGGVHDAAFNNQVVIYNQKIIEPEEQPVRDTDNDGTYYFRGWNTNADGTGVYWNFNDTITTSMTLYAIWNKEPIYHVAFTDEMFQSKVTSQKTSESQSYLISEPTELDKDTTNIKDNSKYTFKGWNTKADGSGRMWDFERDIVDKDIILYAQWEQDRYYTIKYFDGFSTEEKYSNTSDYIYAYDGKNNAISNFRGYYILDKDRQILGSSNTRNSEPTFKRINYVFDGWYLEDGTKFDRKDSINENGGDKIAIEQDGIYTINLVARWTPVYKGTSAVEIETVKLDDGIYKTYYSQYLEAYSADKAASRIYRNFILTNSKGQVRSEHNALPEGLHLNSRTGEIYGVPKSAGEYEFYVRLADDEGNWISSVEKVSVVIQKRNLDISLSEKSEAYDKIYGSDDPDAIYNTGESKFVINTNEKNYEKAEYSRTEKVDTYENKYSFKVERDEHYSDGFDENTSEIKQQLSMAPDLNDEDMRNIPESLSDVFSVSLKREKGEDVGTYRRYVEITGTEEANYSISNKFPEKGVGSDSNANPYYFTILKKEISYHNDKANKHYIYGDLSRGAKLIGGEFDESYEPVQNKTFNQFDGYKINDTESIELQNNLDKKYLSNSNRVKAGKYNNSTDNIFGFKTTNKEYQDSPDANNATNSADTSNNYKEELSLSIDKKELGLSGKSIQTFARTNITASNVKSLATLVGVIKGDSVDIANAEYTINNKIYKTPEGAAQALSSLAKKKGTYKIKIHVEALSGNDASNYSIDSTVESTISVKNAVLLASAKTYNINRNVKVSWNAISGVDHYVVYGAKCEGKIKKLATVKASSKLSYTHNKLNKYRKYKYSVVAYNMNQKVAESTTVHVIVGQKSGKYSDAKKVSLSKSAYTLSAGSKIKLKVKVATYSNKMQLKTHGAVLRYKVADDSIVKISSTGEMKALKSGKTKIYVQALDGVWASAIVIVK